ncbi:MAG: hypothetical protein ACOYL5_01470 [Phototrophicaceae bacterium]|jgi:hypothetical protein
MSADMWDWFQNRELQAYRQGEHAVIEVIQQHRQAIGYIEREPQRMVALLDHAIQRSQALQEPCLTLFLKYWRTEAYVFYLLDYQQGLDAATRLFMEANKHDFDSCPVIANAYRILIDVYVYRDPVGYAAKIQELSDFMMPRIHPRGMNRTLLLGRQVHVHIAQEDYAAAHAAAERYAESALTINSHPDPAHNAYTRQFASAYAYNILAYTAWRLGERDNALDYITLAEESARGAYSQASLMMALMWHAALLADYNDLESAAPYYWQAIRMTNTLGLQPYMLYYDGAALYLERSAHSDEAMALRDQQLHTSLVLTSPYFAAEAHLRRCRLLHRRGQLTAPELDRAKAIAAALQQPAYYLNRLANIPTEGNVL